MKLTLEQIQTACTIDWPIVPSQNAAARLVRARLLELGCRIPERACLWCLYFSSHTDSPPGIWLCSRNGYPEVARSPLRNSVKCKSFSRALWPDRLGEPVEKLSVAAAGAIFEADAAVARELKRREVVEKKKQRDAKKVEKKLLEHNPRSRESRLRKRLHFWLVKQAKNPTPTVIRKVEQLWGVLTGSRWDNSGKKKIRIPVRLQHVKETQP